MCTTAASWYQVRIRGALRAAVAFVFCSKKELCAYQLCAGGARSTTSAVDSCVGQGLAAQCARCLTSDALIGCSADAASPKVWLIVTTLGRNTQLIQKSKSRGADDTSRFWADEARNPLGVDLTLSTYLRHDLPPKVPREKRQCGIDRSLRQICCLLLLLGCRWLKWCVVQQTPTNVFAATTYR